jgi:formate dehydrogenase gamma subunit
MKGPEPRDALRGVRFGTILLLLIAGVASSRASTNDDCLACHSDPALTMERKGRTVPLRVDARALAGSPHQGLACVDCHQGFDAGNVPHKARITPVDCLDCHADASTKHPFHSTGTVAALEAKGPPGASCKQCHGTHEVKSVKAVTTTGGEIMPFCGRCHASVVARFASSEHGKALAAAAPGAPGCLTCHAQPITPARVAGRSAALKIAQEKICLSCHLDNADVRERMGPSAGFIAAFEKSVHGAALLKGNGDAATCIDCHGSHEMKQGMNPEARVSKKHIPETCASCHADIARQYNDSVHADAVRRGSSEAPVCTDCHGEHNILSHTDPNSPVAVGNISAQVCSPCHSSVKMSQKYGIASDRFRTFSDSYHGLAERAGSLEAANCASCHGAHSIRPSSDPSSSVNKGNLAVTCGKCHPGANARFGIGSVHLAATQSSEPILYWISLGYLILIVVVVGGMFAHNLIDFLRKTSHRLKVRRGEIVEAPAGRALYTRMTPNERIQHALLTLSFTLLAITGFMLRYPDAWWVLAIRSLSDNAFELRSQLHRISGVVMTVASLYHVGYVTLTARGRRLLRDLFPSPLDLRQLLQNLSYNLGISRNKPAFGRFSYIEKSEYWALVWGTFVMVATGAIMWFDNTFIGLLTKLGWDVARTIHFWEAWLATLAILVWHIYFVVFNPETYPMNMAWITGKLSEEEMAAEHPAELAALKKKAKESDERESPGT